MEGEPSYHRVARECLQQESDWELVEAVFDFECTMTGGSPALRKRFENAGLPMRRERDMDTFFEYLEKESRREGRREGRQQSVEGIVQVLRKEMRRRGIAPRAYARDLRSLNDAKRAATMLVGLSRAKDPTAYLRRRFGHWAGRPPGSDGGGGSLTVSRRRRCR